MPLHPTKYAELLGRKMEQHQVNIWLVNTGWSGGPYGVGKRISLPNTRAIITAALDGHLEDVAYKELPIFGLHIPLEVPGVPSTILDPKMTWNDPLAYDEMAVKLAHEFIENFKKFHEFASREIMQAAPYIPAEV